MNSTQLLAQFRLDTRDGVQPYLWSDAEVFAYLDDAQKVFCRLTGGITDATTATARLKLKADTRWANLSPLVMKVRAAFDEDGKKLELVNFEDLEFDGTDGLGLFTDQTGCVKKLVLGMEPNRVRVIDTPTADQTVNMIIYRYPLDSITQTGQDLEIDEQHHLHLLKWARHLAHQKPDAETYDRGRAQQYRQEFEQYCALASEEKSRRDHKHRSVQFSW